MPTQKQWRGFIAIFIMLFLIAVLVVLIGRSAEATTGHDHKEWICHPVNGAGQDGHGWNLINVDKASSHFDKDGHPKHESHDGRVDTYSTNGQCPFDGGVPTPSSSPEPTDGSSPSGDPTIVPTDNGNPTGTPTVDGTTEPSETTSPTGTPSVPATTDQPTATPTKSVVPPVFYEHRNIFKDHCTYSTNQSQHRNAVNGTWINDGPPVRTKHKNTCHKTSFNPLGTPVVTEEGF